MGATTANKKGGIKPLEASPIWPILKRIFYNREIKLFAMDCDREILGGASQ